MAASGCAAWHTGAQRPRRAAPSARSALGAQRPRRAAPCAERRARSARRRSGSPQAPGALHPHHRRRARSARRRQLACCGADSNAGRLLPASATLTSFVGGIRLCHQHLAVGPLYFVDFNTTPFRVCPPPWRSPHFPRSKPRVSTQFDCAVRNRRLDYAFDASLRDHAIALGA